MDMLGRNHSKAKHIGNVGAVDTEVIEVLAREFLSVCVAALKQYGVDSSRLTRLCKEAVELPGKIPTASRLIDDADRLAELATEWMENTAYIDAIGRPKVIPINGPEPSFACLVRKHFRCRQVRAVLEFGLRTRVLERVGAAKVGQFGGCVIFAGNPNLMLVHAIQSVRSFLGTTLRNASLKGSSFSTFPDRKASAVIPEGCTDEFVRIMRQSVINTVEMANRWLAARRNDTRVKNGKAVKMGVHAYVFRDASS